MKYTESATVEGFERFAQSLPCMVWITDANGNPEWHSQKFCDYTGTSEVVALREGWIPSVHPADRLQIAQKWRHSLTSESPLDAVVRLREEDGRYRWFRIRAETFRGADHTVEKWFGIITDIHDRQIAAATNAHVVDVLMEGLLSTVYPKVQGLTFDTVYRAANVMEKVGGDWYDIFELSDGRVAFSLGDVCGHGVEAAVKMGEAKQAIFVAACLGDPAPEMVLKQANKVLFLSPHVSITTALYGVIDTKLHKVTYASAGHHPPILVGSNGKAAVLPNHGFPLGVEVQMPPLINTHEFTYESGSMMVLYTDGLIEFAHDIFDGEHRLLAAAGESTQCNSKQPAKFIVDGVFGELVPIDDVAVLTVTFHEG
ncbi:MAG: SpoIIE family protein phosphatase [Candidatus Tyrphobacter sp.]